MFGVESTYEALSFDKGGVKFGVDMLDVEEIVKTELSAINSIPASPKQLIGVMNIRGHVVPVINTGYIFGLGRELPLGDETTLLIAKYDGELIGLVVDVLGDVMYYSTLSLVEDSALSAFTKGCIKCEDGRGIYMLDIARLFDRSLEMD